MHAAAAVSPLHTVAYRRERKRGRSTTIPIAAQQRPLPFVPLSAFGAIRPFIIYILIYYNRSSAPFDPYRGERDSRFSFSRLFPPPPPFLSLRLSLCLGSLVPSSLVLRKLSVSPEVLLASISRFSLAHISAESQGREGGGRWKKLKERTMNERTDGRMPLRSRILRQTSPG